jgi:prepilin-type processing-associated H-X9-DG protein
MNQIEDKSNKRIYKKSSFSRMFTILVIIIMSIFILVSLILISLPPAGRPDWVMCATNVSGLGKALYLYRSDYDGQYPTGDRWCDLLVMNYEVRLESLICKGSDAKIGESSYALNKNIAGKKSSEIPEGTVVLFETNYGKNPLGRDGTLGEREWYKSLNSISERESLKQLKRSEKVYKLRWNQVGGPELLAEENHKGVGCNFLFNDGHVEFVKIERLGELKWDTEKKDSESID